MKDVQLDAGLQLSKSNPFFGKWDQLVEIVATGFKLDAEEKKRLKTTRIAQLIAAIPFIAGVEEPVRTAVNHLGLYILTVRTKHIFDHKFSDNEHLLKRIQLLDNYMGGDRQLIERGLSLIALNIVNDYNRDREEDREQGKYNPFNDGQWDYEKCRTALITRIELVESYYMDEILMQHEVTNSWCAGTQPEQ